MNINVLELPRFGNLKTEPDTSLMIGKCHEVFNPERSIRGRQSFRLMTLPSKSLDIQHPKRLNTSDRDRHFSRSKKFLNNQLEKFLDSTVTGSRNGTQKSFNTIKNSYEQMKEYDSKRPRNLTLKIMGVKLPDSIMSSAMKAQKNQRQGVNHFSQRKRAIRLNEIRIRKNKLQVLSNKRIEGSIMLRTRNKLNY